MPDMQTPYQIENLRNEITRLNSVIAERDAESDGLIRQIKIRDAELQKAKERADYGWKNVMVLENERKYNELTLAELESKLSGCVLVPNCVYDDIKQIFEKTYFPSDYPDCFIQFQKSGDAK